MIEVKSGLIDHPAQPGWLEAGREQAETLTIPGDTTLEAVLSMASIRTDDYRQYFQRVNLLYLQPTTLDTYNSMAGRPEQLGEQIRWFGRMALGAFRRPEDFNRYPFDTVALDLGGVRQLGRWGSDALDVLEASLEARVLETDSAMKVKVMKRPGERETSYRVLPVVLEKTNPDEPLEYGIVRRRRAVASVTLPATPTDPPSVVEISKESTAVYVVNEVTDKRDRRILAHTPREYRAVEGDTVDIPLNDNMLASAAGRVFEAAIEAYKRGEPPEAVAPVSVHLVMLSRRPQA